MLDQNTAELGYYAGVIIDVLGQAQRLSQITEIPDFVSPGCDLIKKLKNTYGVVSGIEKWLDNFYQGYQDTSGLPEDENIRAMLVKHRAVKIIKLKFSDTFIHLVPLKPSDDYVPMASVGAVFHAALTTMITSLAAGYPVRGAVDVGIMLKAGNGDMYGPLFHQLHQLESQVAKWPRIVVGKDLLKYLNAVSGGSGQDDFWARVSSGTANKCLQCIDYECDPFIDFTKEVVIDDGTYNELIIKGRNFAIKSMEEFEFDQKLGPRYNALLRQFDRNIHKWV